MLKIEISMADLRRVFEEFEAVYVELRLKQGRHQYEKLYFGPIPNQPKVEALIKGQSSQLISDFRLALGSTLNRFVMTDKDIDVQMRKSSVYDTCYALLDNATEGEEDRYRAIEKLLSAPEIATIEVGASARLFEVVSQIYAKAK